MASEVKTSTGKAHPCAATGKRCGGKLALPPAACRSPSPPPLSLSPSTGSSGVGGGGGGSSNPAASGRLNLRSLLSPSKEKSSKLASTPRRERTKTKTKTLSRRLNSVEAFFAWGAEVKGAFSIGLCVQLQENKVKEEGKKGGINVGLLRAAVEEASWLDQPLARAVVVRPASFAPFRLPRVLLPASGAPPPEFVVLEREDGSHWEREMERACNRPFRSEVVALEKGKTVRAQRACSFVLLLGGEDEEEGGGGSNKRHHELVVRLNHALFDGKAAVAFLGAMLRRYEAKVAAQEEAEKIAEAVATAAALAAAPAAATDGDDGSEGALTPARALSPSSALSSSPISPLARWPSAPSTPGEQLDGGSGSGSGDSRSPSPEPRSSSSPSSPPLSSSSAPFFTSLPPSSSALSLRLGPRAFLTRIVANVMLMHEGLALARKGLGLRLPAGGAEKSRSLCER